MALITSAPTIKKQVATRSGFPNRAIGATGSFAYNEIQSWFDTLLTVDTNNIEVGWSNYGISTTYNGLADKEEIVTTGYPGFTVRAAVSVGASIYPLYSISGSRDMRVEPGESKRFAPLPQALTAGSTLKIRYRIIYDSLPTRWLTFENHQFSNNESGTGLTDRTTAASWNSPPNPSGYVLFPPTIILGETTNKKSIEIWGDSIGSNGQSDGGYVADLGYILRSCTANSIPWINNGRQSMAMWQYASESAGWKDSRLRRRAMVPAGSVSHVFLQMCTNDLSWNNSDTAMVNSMLTLKAQADALGYKLIPMTCNPRTNAANNAKFGTDTVDVWGWRQNYNAYIRANNGCGYGFFDAAAVTEDGSTNLWLSGYTSDGIHPNGTAHAAMQNALNLKLPELLGQWGGI